MQDEGLKRQILELFRRKGMRVTRQRELILDIILENECTCCKEIYYRAAKKDKDIGIATVYRMVNSLAEMGIFRQNIPYCLAAEDEDRAGNGCRIFLKDRTVVDLDADEWESMLRAELVRKGCPEDVQIDRVTLK